MILVFVLGKGGLVVFDRVLFGYIGFMVCNVVCVIVFVIIGG